MKNRPNLNQSRFWSKSESKMPARIRFSETYTLLIS